MKLRRLTTGNYFGYYKGMYVFLRKRVHGKWDGHEKYKSWWTALIGKNGEWLFGEGVFGSYLNTLKKAKWWAKRIIDNHYQGE